MTSPFISIIMKSLGLDTPTLIPMFYMTVRGIIIFFVGIFLARFNKKLIGIRTPFNFILFVMLGSIFAQAIIDVKSFLPILGTIFILFLLNGLMTMLSFSFRAVEEFIKGAPVLLIKNGTVQWKNMKKYYITEVELLNELHTQLHTEDIAVVEKAFLASDGTINFIIKK